MNRLKSSFAAKAFAVLLFLLSIVFLALSAIGILVMEEAGVYSKSKDELSREAYEKVCENYAVTAMADYEGDFHKEMLSETNFLYGIVKTEDIKKADLNKKQTYVMNNFGNMVYELERDDLCIFAYDIHRDGSQHFDFGTSLWDDYRVIDLNEGFRLEEYPLEGYYYDLDNEKVYARSGRMLFCVDVEYVLSKDNIRFWLDNDCIQYTGTYGWKEDYKELGTIYGDNIPVKDVQIISAAELAKLGEEVDSFDSVYDGIIYVPEEYIPDTERYYVVCTARNPLEGIGSFRDSDMFVQSYLLIQLCYQVRFAAIAILLLSLAVLIASFLFLMSAAGHHRWQEGICPVLLDKAPLDLYLAGVCAAECILVYLYISFAENFAGWRRWPEVLERVSFWLLTAVTGITGILLAVGYCMSLSVNIKLGKWWQRTAVYWILKKSVLFIRRCFRFFIHLLAALGRSVTLFWKICLVLGGIMFVEFVVMVSTRYTEELVLFWLIEKAVVYAFVLYLSMQMLTLQKGAQRIAGGELNYRIDTGRMFWELKKHGQYLNEIGVGMNAAVNERLKSERFRTELITNVSHDIKTPLTSIINYVDLLQKEQIENPAAQEYLEVLSRQSSRLKKLIEDLMEASKASSGSLSVVMEKCDAGVMLVQTVGEFEEKLMADQIELQIKKPEESIFIEADSRHLWRVFDNMMNNICKYAQPMTRAYVNLERQGSRVVITFRNISKYQLNISSEELMERFVRGDSSRNTEGNGLGISIAKSLTELMNGIFSLVIDGDLFKVVLSFPLCEGKEQTRQQEKYMGMTADTLENGNVFFPADIFRGAKPQAASLSDPADRINSRKTVEAVKTNIAAGIKNVGGHARNMGQGAADRTGRMFHFIGRFAHHVKWAARQAKAEVKTETGPAAAGAAGNMQVPAEKAMQEAEVRQEQPQTAGMQQETDIRQEQPQTAGMRQETDIRRNSSA